MNPLLFKPHPLMVLAVDLVTNTPSHSWAAYARLLAIMLCSAGVWASGMMWAVWKSNDIDLKYRVAFLFVVPAVLLYLLPVMTMVNDVLQHHFRWRDRFMLVLFVVMASQMLGVLYGYGIRQPRYNRSIGMQAGLEVSLLLLLLAMLFSLALIGADSAFGIW